MAVTNTYFQILSRGLESSLANLAIEDGKIRFTTDSGKLYLEFKSSEEDAGSRVQITDFVKGKTEEEIKSILAPLDKFYLASDTHHIFIYDSGWVDVTDQQVSKAEADALGQKIAETYIKKISNKGGTFTITKGNDTTEDLETGLAPLDSPIFTGNPQTEELTDLSDSSNRIATTAWVQNFVQKAIENYSNGTLIVDGAVKNSDGTTEELTTADGEVIGFNTTDLNSINRANEQAAKEKAQDEKIQNNAENISTLQDSLAGTNENVEALAKATTEFGTVNE